MCTTEIRDATLGDFAAMSAVYRRASLSNEGDRAQLLAEPTLLELSEQAMRPGRSLVAVRAAQVVGFASVDPVADGLELEALFVDPEHMRHRVGTALVSAVVERARHHGLSTIFVTANVHALPFYRRAGFTEVGTRALKFGPAPRMVLAVMPVDEAGPGPRPGP